MTDSVYVLECVCGATIRTHTTEATCGKCGRESRIEWKKAGTEKTMPAQKRINEANKYAEQG